MKKYLFVIDMQRDFIDGALGTKEAVEMLPNAVEKIRAYAANKDCRLIYTLDTHYSNYYQTQEGRKLPVEHCMIDTPGWNLPSEIYVDIIKRGEMKSMPYMFQKSTFGLVDWKDALIDAIQKEDEIEIIGLCTDICVVSNALILKSTYPENRIVVDSSCCAGTTPENHKAALLTMKNCQIDII